MATVTSEFAKYELRYYDADRQLRLYLIHDFPLATTEELLKIFPSPNGEHDDHARSSAIDFIVKQRHEEIDGEQS
tara:strand:+ start:3348 stop:3572 length:225 start_codon:yes stop_codon:yes gene_type:complete